MEEQLALIGELHLSGFAVENPATNAAGDVMFDVEPRGERR
jgi:hypothetical protein